MEDINSSKKQGKQYCNPYQKLALSFSSLSLTQFGLFEHFLPIQYFEHHRQSFILLDQENKRNEKSQSLTDRIRRRLLHTILPESHVELVHPPSCLDARLLALLYV